MRVLALDPFVAEERSDVWEEPPRNKISYVWSFFFEALWLGVLYIISRLCEVVH